MDVVWHPCFWLNVLGENNISKKFYYDSKLHKELQNVNTLFKGQFSCSNSHFLCSNHLWPFTFPFNQHRSTLTARLFQSYSFLFPLQMLCAFLQVMSVLTFYLYESLILVTTKYFACLLFLVFNESTLMYLCDMICYDMIWYVMIWYMIWYDIWYDMLWYDIYDIWYDMTYDMICYDMIYMIYDMIWHMIWYMIWYDIFVNCSWVATRWQ